MQDIHYSTLFHLHRCSTHHRDTFQKLLCQKKQKPEARLHLLSLKIPRPMEAQA
jgi:hypothetical protein